MTEAELIATAADWTARHAVPLLFALAILLVLATWGFWRLVETWAPRLVDLAEPLWRRLDRDGLAVRYLGWQAALAFVVLALALAGFVELADGIGAGEDFAAIDAALAEAMARHVGPETLQAFAHLTRLGDPGLLFPLGGIAAAAMFKRRQWLLGGSWVVATGGGAALNRLLKEFFARTRPLHEHGMVTETGFSFPSGHASGSMLVYGFAAYLIVRHTPRAWRLPVTVVAMLVIVFVGASRVLLQVHYLSDVLAGWMVAASWLALCIAGLEALRLARERRAGERQTAV